VKSFYRRTLSGIFYVLFIIIFLFSGPLTYYILFLGFLIIGALEFYKIYSDDSPLLWKITNIFVAGIFFTVCFFDAAQIVSVPFSVIITSLVLVIFIPKLFIQKHDIIKQNGYQFILYLYLALPLTISNYIVFSPDQGYIYKYHLLLNIFIMLWCNDTGAYLAGSAIGKHKFLEKISPKKTWEGVIGGAIITLIAAFIIAKNNNSFLSLLHWMILGALIIIFGTLGDLVESMIKRNANVKDTGNLFPGHGGILDRIDSFLLAIIAVFIYLKLNHII